MEYFKNLEWKVTDFASTPSSEALSSTLPLKTQYCHNVSNDHALVFALVYSSVRASVCPLCLFFVHCFLRLPSTLFQNSSPPLTLPDVWVSGLSRGQCHLHVPIYQVIGTAWWWTTVAHLRLAMMDCATWLVESCCDWKPWVAIASQFRDNKMPFVSRTLPISICQDVRVRQLQLQLLFSSSRGQTKFAPATPRHCQRQQIMCSSSNPCKCSR